MRSRAPLLIPDLRATLKGRVIAPEDAGYDEARTLFSGEFDRSPAAIVCVADASEVAHVVRLARETGVELAIRSGGHSAAGHSSSDVGIVLDLRDMRDLDIDVDGRTAWAQTGLTAAEYTTAAGAYGLATGSATRVPWGSEGSRWAAASGISRASMASPSTICSPPRS